MTERIGTTSAVGDGGSACLKRAAGAAREAQLSAAREAS
jgi:hypothetical protein